MKKEEKSLRMFSVSQLKLFALCPLRYKFQYIDSRRSDVQHIESFVGCLVHDSLAYLYQELQKGEMPTIGALSAHYRKYWELKWRSNILITHQEHGREWFRRFGEKTLRNYYVHHYPFGTDDEGREEIGVEWSFRWKIDGEEKYTMCGQIDRLTKLKDKTYIVHDYKTARYVPSYNRLIRDLQPGVYQLAVQRLFPEASRVEVYWHYLSCRRTVEPTRSDKALFILEEELKSRIDHLRETKEFKAKPSPACRWCDYQPLCPSYDEQIQKQKSAPTSRFRAFKSLKSS